MVNDILSHLGFSFLRKLNIINEIELKLFKPCSNSGWWKTYGQAAFAINIEKIFTKKQMNLKFAITINHKTLSNLTYSWNLNNQNLIFSGFNSN